MSILKEFDKALVRFKPGWLFSFSFLYRAGLEPIAEALSGGQCLPPVQTLVATAVFALGENTNRTLPQQS